METIDNKQLLLLSQLNILSTCLLCQSDWEPFFKILTTAKYFW